MIALSLKDIRKSFGADEVLKGVTLHLTDDMRLGLIGRNGAGKTTLLRIISGEIAADAGGVSVPVKAGYLKQEVPAGSKHTVWDEMLGVFEHVFALEQKLRALECDMEAAAGSEAAWKRVSREYDSVTKAFEEAGGYGYKSAISGVLHGLSLGEDVHGRPVGTLSGGQRARLALAKLLLEKPELLLLDEPTNHLDTEAICWLESYLKVWQGAVVIVSHDRWFLDQICTHIAELHGGKLKLYPGNYSAYAAQRRENRVLAQKAYEQNRITIDRHKKVIAQYRAWGRAGGGKNFIKAQARETILNKIERMEKPDTVRSMSLQLSSKNRSGNDVLFMDKVAMAFPGAAPLFEDLSLLIRHGDRAALVGPNGIGKTTLLRIAAGSLKPLAGNIGYGAGVKPGYYDQHQQSLCEESTVLEELRNSFPALDDGGLRNALAAFLFFGDDVFKPVSALSGGEKGRLSLLKLMLGGHNLLLLDEPTNHLDMDSREMLEDALCAYDGSALIISHDRYFINKVSTRVLELKDGSLTAFEGNWSDYAQAQEQARQPQPQQEDSSITKTAAVKQKRADKQAEQQLRDKRRQAQHLETDITAAERKLADIGERLAQPAGLDAAELTALSQDYENTQAQIEHMMQAWERAHEAF